MPSFRFYPQWALKCNLSWADPIFAFQVKEPWYWLWDGSRSKITMWSYPSPHKSCKIRPRLFLNFQCLKKKKREKKKREEGRKKEREKKSHLLSPRAVYLKFWLSSPPSIHRSDGSKPATILCLSLPVSSLSAALAPHEYPESSPQIKKKEEEKEVESLGEPLQRRF